MKYVPTEEGRIESLDREKQRVGKMREVARGKKDQVYKEMKHWHDTNC